MMRIAWALLCAETIKLRRTAAVWLALAAPVVVILVTLISFFNDDLSPRLTPPGWWRFLLQRCWLMWTGFFAPVLIAFEAASLARLEYRANQWKQLFAFPIPHWSYYATKMLFCAVLVSASFVIATFGFVGSVLIYGGSRGLHLASAIPWIEILSTAGTALGASLLAMVIQSWISARWSGMAASLGAGLAGLVIGVVLLPRHGDGYFSWWYPWTLPLRTLSTGLPHSAMLPLMIGSIGGLVAGALACWNLARRRELPGD